MALNAPKGRHKSINAAPERKNQKKAREGLGKDPETNLPEREKGLGERAGERSSSEKRYQKTNVHNQAEKKGQKKRREGIRIGIGEQEKA